MLQPLSDRSMPLASDDRPSEGVRFLRGAAPAETAPSPVHPGGRTSRRMGSGSDQFRGESSRSGGGGSRSRVKDGPKNIRQYALVSGDVYDAIGAGYRTVRRPDPRIAAQIRRAMGDARTLVNVGAGSGSYEPDDLPTVAVEPSRVMISHRGAHSAPAIQARAEQLPFPDRSFDVATALLTVHHWTDILAGLTELRRVSRRQVVLTWDPEVFAQNFWFVREYLPQPPANAGLGTAQPIAELLRGSVALEPVLVPADCLDGFYAAYWARPEAYLSPDIRAGISSLVLEEDEVVADAVTRLAADLRSGDWDRHHPGMRDAHSFDAGYRLVVSD
jgi:hypothetical protein